ncbi:MsnO8 family LLM class oxidoreductase [Aquicoccus sp. SU-CL01552]|uniref:MsnO8 family LLM class oxidoreductase n=1 Tax=Aquicoccus sp. SU-CL01552 TaxID=3127656 RepID=UPI0031079E91
MKLSILDALPICLGETGLDAIRNGIELARHADRLGFHRYWLTEHHGVPSEPATAPEHLIPSLLAETQNIRVGAGGILLNHHSPYKVALNFRTLLALHPERLDLGVGRASSGAAADLALMRDREAANQIDRDADLDELVRWLGKEPQADARLNGLAILPELPPGPSPWVLCASIRSARHAAENGLCLAFGAFIAPQEAEAALQAYFQYFRPASHRAGIAEPKAILAVRVAVAETREQAERQAMPMRLMMRLRRGEGRFIERLPTPEEAIRQWGGVVPAEGPPEPGGAWPDYVVGDAARVADTLDRMARITGVGEVMIQDFVPVHAQRLQTCSLIAKQFGGR